MVGQLDPAYSSMEKRGAAYVPSVAEYGKKRKTTRNIFYAAGCIFGVGLVAWMVHITLMVNKDVSMRDKHAQVFGGPHAINNSGPYENMIKELGAMKKILGYMTQEQATSRLEANPNEMQRRTTDVEAGSSNLRSFLGDIEFRQEKNSWIEPEEGVSSHYVSFFAEDSRPLVEKTDENRGNSVSRAEQMSWTKLNIERPLNLEKNKEFVFSLRYTQGNCLEIKTSSGLIAVASNGRSVILEQDMTTTTTTTNTTTTPTTTSNSTTTSTTTFTTTSTTNTTTTTSTTTTTTLSTETLGPSCWLLSKYKEKFYTVESATHRGKFWNTKPDVSPDGALVLSEAKELFTGIHTNFIVRLSLGRSNDYPSITQPSTPISEDMTGDVKIHYLDRKGDEHTGYVCDNEWGYDDAISFCNTKWKGTAGIPTYRGHFSKDIDTLDFTISGLSCKKEDVFEDCGFKTECPKSSPNSCRAQKSMRLMNGKGFACGLRDAAGVVCGTKEQIKEMKDKEQEAFCNSTEIVSSKMSISQMASLEEQAKEASKMMSENKHWSEFLLPIPMTVSMISMLMLISAQYEGKVELPRPSSGAWEELKWDLLTPNLYELNGMITDAFDRSTTAMKKVNVNSENMNNEFVNCITWVTTQSNFAKVRLQRSLKNIGKYATRNSFEAAETIKRFEDANRFIQELLTAMKNAQKLQEDEKQTLTTGLAAMKNQTTRDQEQLEKQEKDFDEYNKKVKKTRDELYEAAHAIETSSCLMDNKCTKEGTRPCEKCEWRPNSRVKDKNGEDVCLIEGEKCLKQDEWCEEEASDCISYKDAGCAQQGEVCVKSETHTSTVLLGLVSSSQRTECVEKKPYCIRPNPQVCQETKEYCKKNSLRCVEAVDQCANFAMLPEGTFCKDSKVCCSGCAGRKEMKEILSSVLQNSLMLDMKSLQDDSNIDIIHNILEVTLGISSKMNEKVNLTPNRRSKRQSEQAGNETTTKEDKVEITLETEIQSFVLSLPLQNKQLEQIAKKNPLANEAIILLKNFELVISKIKVNTPITELSDLQKTSLNDMHEKITNFANTIAEEAKKFEIDVSKSSFKGPSEISKKAEAYMDNQIKRMKAERRIESITQNIESALAEMATKKINMNDFKATINYLVTCAEYLTQLKAAWGNIKDFFSSIGGLLDEVKNKANRMDADYGDILKYSNESRSDIIEKSIEKTTVQATAFNIYIKKVSSFYVTIMETGLLEKIRGLNFDRLKPEVFQKTKVFILREARTMQRSISEAVSAEQAELNDELNQKMWSVKKLLCGLGEIQLLGTLEDKEKEVKRIAEVVSGTEGRGLDDDTLKEAGIIEDAQTLTSVEGATFNLWAG